MRYFLLVIGVGFSTLPLYFKYVQVYFFTIPKLLPTYVYKQNTCAQHVYILLLILIFLITFKWKVVLRVVYLNR